MRKKNPAVAIAKLALMEIRSQISLPLKKTIKAYIKKGMPAHKAVKTAFKYCKVGPKLQKIILDHTDKVREKV